MPKLLEMHSSQKACTKQTPLLLSELCSKARRSLRELNLTTKLTETHWVGAAPLEKCLCKSLAGGTFSLFRVQWNISDTSSRAEGHNRSLMRPSWDTQSELLGGALHRNPQNFSGMEETPFNLQKSHTISSAAVIALCLSDEHLPLGPLGPKTVPWSHILAFPPESGFSSLSNSSIAGTQVFQSTYMQKVIQTMSK